MDYFLINLMPSENEEYCFLRSFPEGMGLYTYKLMRGVEVVVGSEYPVDARLYMDARERGIELPSLIGNTCSMLVVDKPMRDALDRVNTGSIQILPVSIYNHKKRLASADYFIINPLGTWDCLDTGRSRIVYQDDGKVVSVKEDEMVIQADKMRGAPDIFRVREDPTAYVVSEAVVIEWIDLQPRPTNVMLIELQVTEPAS